MTDLLAIDTTTDSCSVALVRGDHWVEHTRFAPRLHNRHILAMLDGVLHAANEVHSRADDAAPIDVANGVRFIAFGAGPGSFTGVRIGAAVAQGLAFAIGARAIPVPSSAVVAETARAAGRRGVFAICRESRPGWHYVASYQLADDGISCVAFDQLQPVDAQVSTDSVDGARVVVRAGVVARLALQRIDEAVPASQALPIYVDGDTPWQPSIGKSGGAVA